MKERRSCAPRPYLKAGSRWLRWAMVEAAIHALRDPESADRDGWRPAPQLARRTVYMSAAFANGLSGGRHCCRCGHIGQSLMCKATPAPEVQCQSDSCSDLCPVVGTRESHRQPVCEGGHLLIHP